MGDGLQPFSGGAAVSVRCGPRVYVVGAYVPNGGTYMAYHLGRLVQDEFGYAAVAVRLARETHADGVQSYDTIFPAVSVRQMEEDIRPDDLLIANPSFSAFNFGLRLQCRKLMYIQGFNTFSVLDMAFDRYVCASDFVHGVMAQTYCLRASVIPPFIEAAQFPPPPPWPDRPRNTVLVHQKGDAVLQKLLLDRVQSHSRSAAVHIRFEPLAPAPLPQADFVRRLGQHRYLLTLAVTEGFGLVPLEAMAMGVVVVGFDGYGGRQYMQSGFNCLVSGYPDVDAVARNLVTSMQREADAQLMAEQARFCAAEFNYARFRAAWIAELKSFLPAHSSR